MFCFYSRFSWTVRSREGAEEEATVLREVAVEQTTQLVIVADVQLQRSCRTSPVT